MLGTNVNRAISITVSYGWKLHKKLMVWFGLVTKPAWSGFMASNNSSAAFLPNCSKHSCKLSWRLVKNVIATNTAGKGFSGSLKISEGFTLTNTETPSQQRSLIWQPTCPTKTNTAANCLNVLSFFCFFPQTNPMLKIPHSMSLTTLKCGLEQWSPVFAAFMPNCNKHGCRVYRHLIKNILKILKNVPIYRLMSQKTQKKTLYLQIWWTEGWGGLLLADETVLPLKQIKSLKSKTLE